MIREIIFPVGIERSKAHKTRVQKYNVNIDSVFVKFIIGGHKEINRIYFELQQIILLSV